MAIENTMCNTAIQSKSFQLAICSVKLITTTPLCNVLTAIYNNHGQTNTSPTI